MPPPYLFCLDTAHPLDEVVTRLGAQAPTRTTTRGVVHFELADLTGSARRPEEQIRIDVAKAHGMNPTVIVAFKFGKARDQAMESLVDAVIAWVRGGDGDLALLLGDKTVLRGRADRGSIAGPWARYFSVLGSGWTVSGNAATSPTAD